MLALNQEPAIPSILFDPDWINRSLISFEAQVFSLLSIAKCRPSCGICRVARLSLGSAEIVGSRSYGPLPVNASWFEPELPLGAEGSVRRCDRVPKRLQTI